MKKILALILVMVLMLSTAVAEIKAYGLVGVLTDEGVTVPEDLPNYIMALDFDSNSCIAVTDEGAVEGLYEMTVSDENEMIAYAVILLNGEEEPVMLIYDMENDLFVQMDSETGLALVLIRIEIPEGEESDAE